MQEILREIEDLTRAAATLPTPTGIPRVLMIRGQVPDSQLAAVYEPMIGVVIQGAKTLRVGNATLHYLAPSYFVLPVELPASGTVHQGVDGRPYLSVSLSLDHQLIADLLADVPQASSPDLIARELEVCPATYEFLDAWRRMLRLVKNPSEIPALAPSYEREILFRVLQGPQGWMLRDIAKAESSLNQVRKTAAWIRANFSKTFTVEQLAQDAVMSVTAFHRHFKSVTGMSPIQYQKHLRLLEARKLIVLGARPVSATAYEVGYESPSQFTREYARLFGRSPARDAAYAPLGSR